jgi:hypothetical protein
MPMPNGGLITETNRQYYEGVQSFIGDGFENNFVATFNTDLQFYSWDPSDENYPLNNFKVYISDTGLPNSFVECFEEFTVENNAINFVYFVPDDGAVLVIQLKTLDGGNYGDEDAYGNTVEENYGGYQYIKLVDIVNNFMMAYVGNGKLIPDVKRTDVIFHAKRGLQEFSYDTLKTIKAQELTVPPSLSVVIPQDYVNYVKISWVDRQGRKRPIYPANNLTSNPSEMPLQDDRGVPVQDQFNDNIQTDSIMEERWRRANQGIVNGLYFPFQQNDNVDQLGYGWDRDNYVGFGRLYGLDPQFANINGWFTINSRENKISFSSNLVGANIVIDYVSDGLAYDLDSRLPKMAEEAMYAHILHAVIATRSSSPEYLVQRLKHERSAKLRNTKIRLSNIKIEEITQVLRGQSKWIKH